MLHQSYIDIRTSIDRIYIRLFTLSCIWISLVWQLLFVFPSLTYFNSTPTIVYSSTVKH